MGIIVCTLVLLSILTYMVFNRCHFCKARIRDIDRMQNGRVRFRAKGTNVPVCRCCANIYPGDVE